MNYITLDWFLNTFIFELFVLILFILLISIGYWLARLRFHWRNKPKENINWLTCMVCLALFLFELTKFGVGLVGKKLRSYRSVQLNERLNPGFSHT